MTEKEEAVKSIEEQNDISPKTKKLAWWVFLLFGITVLIPFNCLIVPVDYWFNQYPSSVLTSISLTETFFNSAATFLMMKYSVIMTVKFRILLTLTTWLCLMLIVPFAQLFTFHQYTRMAIVLICVAFEGISAGVFFTTSMGLASSLDTSFIAAFNGGSGVAGLIAQSIRIITKPIIPFNINSPDYSPVLYYTTIAYFIIGAMFIVSTYFSYFWLFKKYGVKLVEFDAIDRQNYYLRKNNQAVSPPGSTFLDAVKNLWMPGLSLFLVFFVTLSLFPAVTVQIMCYTMFKTNESGKYGDWWQIIMFTWFMIGDWLGRQLPSWKWGLSIWNVKSLFVAAIVRLVFIALFIIQIVPYYQWPAGTPSPAPPGAKPIGLPIVHNDTFAWIVMILFALTNGWFMSAIFCKFETIMKPETNQTHAANFMTLCLILGLLFGSSLGTIVSLIVETEVANLSG